VKSAKCVVKIPFPPQNQLTLRLSLQNLRSPRFNQGPCCSFRTGAEQKKATQGKFFLDTLLRPCFNRRKCGVSTGDEKKLYRRSGVKPLYLTDRRAKPAYFFCIYLSIFAPPSKSVDFARFSAFSAVNEISIKCAG